LGRGLFVEELEVVLFMFASLTFTLLRFGVTVPFAVVVVLDIGTGSCTKADLSTRTRDESVSLLSRREPDKIGGRGFVISSRAEV
jgi:hypothetical protein